MKLPFRNYHAAGGLTVSEQHVEAAKAATVSPAIKMIWDERSGFTERRFATVGQIKRCCEEIDKTGPAEIAELLERINYAGFIEK